MRFLFGILLISFFSLTVNAQTKADTIHLLRETAELYDLDFTESEADSMIGNVTANLQLYKAMHKTLPTNDIPYPFAFNPIPYGVIKQRTSQTVSLPFRADMQLPKNKNDLAFLFHSSISWIDKNEKNNICRAH